MTGAHADAIWISGTTSSVSITNNFIDWTANADAAAGTNNAIRITGESGNTKNVAVSGNYLLGGGYTIAAGNNITGTLTNVSITGNFVGFGQYGAYYPTTASAAKVSGNTIFDWTNPQFSTSAWSAYLHNGLTTPNLIVSSGSTIASSSSNPTTLYGAGYKTIHLFGTGLSETNYVGGYGGQYLNLGMGANIVTELSVSDSSTMTGVDAIAGFDPAKDVIDLSRIDANIMQAGVQNFTFIGSSAFSGAGAQVRYYQDPTNKVTWVQAKLAGDTSADMTIKLAGLLTLTPANFALTPAASAADAANAAAMSAKYSPSGSARQWAYSNVKGRTYSTYSKIMNGGAFVVQDFSLSSTSNQLTLSGSNVTISRESGTEIINAGTGRFAQTYHANETTQIESGAGAETFNLGLHFGAETISGFSASGSNADIVRLPVAAFSYLNKSMSQAQDLAAVLAHASSATSGITIRDSYGDALTLVGMTAHTLAASSSIRFV